MYACLAVTCHLHFWQNDRDFLRATVVTRGWNGYRNKSQHRKSTLEKKILPPFQQGFEPATFQSRVRRANHWAIPRGVWHSKYPFYSLSSVVPRAKAPIEPVRKCKGPVRKCKRDDEMGTKVHHDIPPSRQKLPIESEVSVAPGGDISATKFRRQREGALLRSPSHYTHSSRLRGKVRMCICTDVVS